MKSPIALYQLAQIADYTTQQVWKIEESFPNLTQEQRDVYINQVKEEAIKAGTISYLTAL